MGEVTTARSGASGQEGVVNDAPSADPVLEDSPAEDLPIGPTAEEKRKEEEDPAAAQSLATALLDESRKRFDASEKRLDDLRNRGRGLAAAVGALLALDTNLLISLSDPSKHAPIVSIALAVIGTVAHLFLLRVMVRVGYGFQSIEGFPSAKKVVDHAFEKGQLASTRELMKHYANAAARFEKRYGELSEALSKDTEQIAVSLVFPVLAVLYFAFNSFLG